MKQKHQELSIDTGEIAPLSDKPLQPREFPSVIRQLAELPPGTLVTQKALGEIFNRHVNSVAMAVERQELPEPCEMFGAKVWTVGTILAHIEQRIAQMTQEAAKDRKRLSNVSPLSKRW